MESFWVKILRELNNKKYTLLSIGDLFILKVDIFPTIEIIIPFREFYLTDEALSINVFTVLNNASLEVINIIIDPSEKENIFKILKERIFN